MKNMIDICKEFGLEVPADKVADFNKAVAENYKTIAEHDKKVSRLTEDLNAEKEARKTAEDTLKGFEGKDFEAITKDRDEWKRKHDEAEQKHRQEAEEREFNEVLSTAITEAQGKNAKAITAMLDLEALRKSRNQKADVQAALEAVRTEHGYMFEDNGGKPRFTQPAGQGGGRPGTLTKEDIGKITDRDERRAAIARNMHLFQKGE